MISNPQVGDHWKRSGVQYLPGFQDDLGHCSFLGVGYREVGVSRAQPAEELCRFAVESHSRASARNSHDLNVLPGDAAVPAGADGLHGSFLGGEAAGVAFRLVRLGLAVADLVRSEDALQKAPPEALNRGRDAIYLCNVNAGSDNHL